MASSSSQTVPSRVLEGVFAINKPNKPGKISSADVIREVQSHFKASSLFTPWLEREQARKDGESHNQKRKRKSWKQRQPPQVKIGHGGTLDPMATGVLILGVGSGTKHLSDFLACTKTYDAVVLFGASTDSYDAVGKIAKRKSYQHITREMVAEALGKFRGKIMQRPPLYSALRVNGKRGYEYGREGLSLEMEEREVEVEELQMLEWMEGGTHEWQWPTQEMDASAQTPPAGQGSSRSEDATTTPKRKRNGDGSEVVLEENTANETKRQKLSLPEGNTELESAEEDHDPVTPQSQTAEPDVQAQDPCPAPACRLRMTVTSGFYVRSLCHDLGVAVGSLALMSSLVRSRQGEFELDKNVLEYDDLAKGSNEWEPKVKAMLEDWQAKHEQRSTNVDIREHRAFSEKTNPRSSYRRLERRRNSSSDEA